MDERDDGTSVIVVDTFGHRVEVHGFGDGELTGAIGMPLQLDSGTGPRHVVLGPNRNVLYSVNEYANTITVASYDAATGLGLSVLQTISTLRGSDIFDPPLDPEGTYPQKMAASEILLHPSGEYVMASNRELDGRGRDTIVVYKIDPSDGTLEVRQHQWAGGKFPRHFSFSEKGNYLYAVNQLSNEIATFSVNTGTGMLTLIGRKTPVGNTPTHLLLLPGVGDTSTSTDDDGLSTGAVAGIVIGSFAVASLVGFLAFNYKRSRNEASYDDTKQPLVHNV